MQAINIKNISVQPNVGPSVSMRILDSVNTKTELAGLQDGDILNAKSIKTLLDSVVGTQGPKGDTGATGPMPTLVNNLTSTSTTVALTGAQGKVLNDLIVALTARVAALEKA